VYVFYQKLIKQRGARESGDKTRVREKQLHIPNFEMVYYYYYYYYYVIRIFVAFVNYPMPFT
jgi:hypothetical protein